MTKMKSNTRGSGRHNRDDEALKVPDQLQISGGIYERGNKRDGRREKRCNRFIGVSGILVSDL